MGQCIFLPNSLLLAMSLSSKNILIKKKIYINLNELVNCLVFRSPYLSMKGLHQPRRLLLAHYAIIKKQHWSVRNHLAKERFNKSLTFPITQASTSPFLAWCYQMVIGFMIKASSRM